MSRGYYIDGRNLPPRLGLIQLACLWMLLDYTDCPEWAFGVYGCLCLVMGFGWLHKVITKRPIDIFDLKKQEGK